MFAPAQCGAIDVSAALPASLISNFLLHQLLTPVYECLAWLLPYEYPVCLLPDRFSSNKCKQTIHINGEFFHEHESTQVPYNRNRCHCGSRYSGCTWYCTGCWQRDIQVQNDLCLSGWRTLLFYWSRKRDRLY